jgi:hypothetical protein
MGSLGDEQAKRGISYNCRWASSMTIVVGYRLRALARGQDVVATTMIRPARKRQSGNWTVILHGKETAQDSSEQAETDGRRQSWFPLIPRNPKTKPGTLHPVTLASRGHGSLAPDIGIAHPDFRRRATCRGINSSCLTTFCDWPDLAPLGSQQAFMPSGPRRRTQTAPSSRDHRAGRGRR